ncbi:MAG: hypothetical protein AB1465_05675 [Patescibacteria group bacterium]
MTNNLIKEKILSWLLIIKKDLELGKQGLIKSERLSQDKNKIEDEILKIKDELSEIEQLKFDKIKSPWRYTPKTGVFVRKGEVEKALTPIKDYLEFLFEQNFRIKIKNQLENEKLWVKSQIDGEDTHFFIGEKDSLGEKVHLISDGGTGELRIDPKDKNPHDLLTKITTIIETKSGEKIKSTHASLEFMENEEKEN